MWWAYLLGTAAILGFLWWYLHRDPDRRIEGFDGYLSPADGVVVAVHDISQEEHHIKKGRHGITAFLSDAPWAEKMIVIMMKPQHVHVQRSPVTGRIASLRHKPGTLKNAVFGDWWNSTVENEHVMFHIRGERPCKVYLIAGLLARRIVPIASKGQHVLQGDRIGRINFGSQVVLVLPRCDILVSDGDKVKAGLTRMAQ